MKKRGANRPAQTASIVGALLLSALTGRAAHAESETAAPASSTEPARRPYRLYAGPQIGLLLPFGVGAAYVLRHEERVRFAFDFLWEPSNYLQSYSVGANYHVLDRVFFVGGRARFMQMHSPFSRGFRARRDNQLAFGPEIGVAIPLDRAQRFVPFGTLGAIFFPSEVSSLPPMYTLDLGVSFGVL
jgi:hypothetical protein